MSKTAAQVDDEAVDEFAAAMKEKLAKKRRQGKRGWRDCSAHSLAVMLIEHANKGDPVDVANFAMMLWHVRGSLTNGEPLRSALREVAAEILRDAK